MTEPTNAPDFDLEAWLDGAKRTERAVTIYGRADLLADIDELEREQRTLRAIPEGDRALSDGNGDQLQVQIDALYLQLDASKMVLRVRALIDDETEKIRTEAEEEIKGAIDKAASNARAEALRNCKRADPGMAANDKNNILRNAAAVAMKATLDREVDIRTIAAAVVSPSMDVARVKRLIDVIGETQVNMIKAAYSRASNEEPKVVLPKSLTHSQSSETSTSS